MTALEQTIARLGGPTEVSHICHVSYWTVRDWRAKGLIPHGKSAVLLARAAHAIGLEVTVDELVGLGRRNGAKPHP